MFGPFLHSGLDKWALELPSKPALLEYKEGEVRVTHTYEELLSSVKRLEGYLLHTGVKRNSETLVLVWGNPLDSIMAFHAVSRSGNAYIPCDARTPSSRVRAIVGEAKPAVILASDSLLQHKEDFVDLKFVSISEVLASQEDFTNEEAVESELTKDSLGFVVFTSGTTGAPKGVALSHLNYLNRIYWFWNTFPATPDEVFCLNSSTNFIDAACEIFGAMGVGASLLVLTPEQVRDPIVLCDALRMANVPSILCVPTLLRMMLLGASSKGGLAALLPSLRTWFLSGEALPIDLLASLFEEYPDGKAINVWGASEANDATAVIMTSKDVEKYRERNLVLAPIGVDIPGCNVIVLDDDRQLLPPGEPGELWMFGNSVARGYLYNPEATTERFITFKATDFDVEWTFDVSSGYVRGFKSGDLGRVDEDGNINCLGRADHQVKVRGNRVNLLEIEAALRNIISQAGFSDLAVVAFTVEGIASLGAALSPDTGDMKLLRKVMKENLVSYMIPSKLLLFPSIPRGGTGKVDRNGLRQQLADLTDRSNLHNG